MRRTVIAIALVGWTVVAGRPLAAEETSLKLDVYPPDVQLNTSRDSQAFIALVTRPDGVTLDVTKQAKATLADAALVRLEGNTLLPAADGATTLNVEYEGLKASLPITVKDAAVDRAISFRLDVMPIFMRSGCNTGSCHGAARGKDGFNLSLFGFDPAGDHHRITHEIGFRRINLALPRESLLLKKAAGQVPHTGGKRFAEDSPYYQTVLRWLESGVPNDPPEVATCTALEIYPPKAVLEGEGATQQFIARAKYSDGTDRDVTDLAVFLTNNDNSAPMDANGLVTAGSRGEAFVMARFATHTVGSQVLVLPKDLQYTPPDEPPVNYVDELVNAKLRKIRILPSGLCDDETFLRRVTIDITGVLPTVEEYQQFVADTDPAKRANLIERLLSAQRVLGDLGIKWADLLMVKTSNEVSYKSMFLYSNWLTNQIQNNVPLDKMVQDLFERQRRHVFEPGDELLSDRARYAEDGRERGPGVHGHSHAVRPVPQPPVRPLDDERLLRFCRVLRSNRTQDGTGLSRNDRLQLRRRRGETSGRRAEHGAKFLGGIEPDVNGKDRREVLVKWLASPENPYFATSIANRVWAHFFGIGIVEPVDDIRVSNPSSNPELFAALGEKLTSYNYDFKQLVRDICNSHAYQRSTQANDNNAEDLTNFSHARIRRIPAEGLLDCLTQVTAVPDKFQGLPLGARAVQIADGNASNYFLTTFGRSPRLTVCEGEATTEPTLSQALHMLNGDTISRKIGESKRLQQLLDEGKSPAEIVEHIYMACLSRKPSPEELTKLEPVLAAANDNPRAAVDDVLWAVLNSREYLFNH